MRKELGYYTVNGVHFTNKLLAILEAQRLNTDVEWYFFDEAYNRVDWTIEPPIDIDEMYRQRALQIREAYDYVIIRASGGADSTNVVWSFLNNGIHVDEIIADIPMSGISNWQFNTVDTSVDNCASEFKYAQIPLLQEISIKHPNVKITMRDPFEEILQLQTDEWLYECQGIINPMTSVMARFDKMTHIANLAEAGKRIAVISGIDKPVLTRLPSGEICSMFSDTPVYASKPPFKIDYPNVDRVLFYWTHEMPELIVKMSHVAARGIHRPENSHLYKAMIDARNINPKHAEIANSMTQDQILSQILNKNKAGYTIKKHNPYNPYTVFHRGIVPFIYPKHYDPNLFQADKIDPTETFFSRNQEWFRVLHKDLKTIQLLESDFSAIYKIISPKYLNYRRTGFNMNIKRYILGHTSKFSALTY
jgi:hypothetical protein